MAKTALSPVTLSSRRRRGTCDLLAPKTRSLATIGLFQDLRNRNKFKRMPKPHDGRHVPPERRADG
jgi:hypothetical protein